MPVANLRLVTIHRVGKRPQAAPPARLGLGCIEVTTDDLEALLQLLQGERFVGADGHPARGKADRVEFDGGYFTEADDLRKMADDEIQRLAVSSASVRVVLGPRQAEAIGDTDAAAEVQRQWARPLRVSPRFLDYVPPPLLFAFALLWGVGPLSAFAGTDSGSLTFGLWWTAVAWIPLVGMSLGYRRQAKTGLHRAKIIPLSRDELRKNVLSQRYPRSQTAWMAATAIITLIGIAVSALVTWSVTKGG